ncbi:MAG: hypothetical protein Q9167_005676 [Letrouitia subvulpina]
MAQAEDRLKSILDQYGSIQCVHPLQYIIVNFDAARCNLFERSLAHEIEKIDRHSQDLEDHEINIYQKAFRILMNQPNTCLGAVHIFIDKILGLKNVGDLHRLYALKPSIRFTSKMLACKLPNFIRGIRITWFPLPSNTAHFKAIFPRPTTGDGYNIRNVKLSYSIEETCNAGREKGAHNAQLISANTPHSFAHNSNFNKNLEGKADCKSDDAKLSQLLATYETALKEFVAAAPDTPTRINTAKFLRDTAENCIHYLETHGGCIMLEKLTEIRAYLAEATVVAEKGMGGKRRRFDYDYRQVPNGPRQDKEGKGAKRPKHSHGNFGQARTRAEYQRGYYDRYIPK